MEPLYVLSTDWHLKDENLDEVFDLVKQQCKLALEIGAKKLGCLGDVFDSRISQRQDVINRLGDILDYIDSQGLFLEMIPGNHDKTVYSIMDSFLDTFQHYPALRVHREYTAMKEGEVITHWIPFFTEKVWMDQFKLLKYKDGFKHILMSHTAVDGSVNNDGTKVESKITPKKLTKLFKVFLGHYHNRQQIGENIHHIQSIKQNNFGEDESKGFTVLYANGDHQFVKSDFKAFRKIKIEVDNLSQKELDSLIEEHSGSDDRVRFEFVGEDTKLKAIDKVALESNGIEVKTKVKEIEDSIKFVESTKLVSLNEDLILKELKAYCKENGKNFKRGSKYIKNHLDGKED